MEGIFPPFSTLQLRTLAVAVYWHRLKNWHSDQDRARTGVAQENLEAGPCFGFRVSLSSNDSSGLASGSLVALLLLAVASASWQLRFKVLLRISAYL